MRRMPGEQLMTFQATAMELVALGSAILMYLRHIRHLRATRQPVSLEQEQVERLLSTFHSRLVEQLPMVRGLRDQQQQ